jgi:hypothetical protein
MHTLYYLWGKVNAFLHHKRKNCIIFNVYDADSGKMMQINIANTEEIMIKVK